jgi:hypothetical protein
VTTYWHQNSDTSLKYIEVPRFEPGTSVEGNLKTD